MFPYSVVDMKMEKSEHSTTLYIDGFIRPFSVEDVKKHVSEGAPPINTEEHFYMNRMNTYCYVTYKTESDAKLAMDYM